MADQDVIAFARADGDACVQVFFIRHGRLIGREYFVLDGTADETDAEIVASFVKQFYDEAAYVPPEILLPHEIDEALVIQEWLRSRRGNKVVLKVPRRGQKRDLVEMATENATETLTHLRAQWLADEGKQAQALAELAGAPGPGVAAHPHRVLRHLDDPGHGHHRLDGRLCQGRAAQERLSPLQDPHAWRAPTTMPACGRCCAAASAAPPSRRPTRDRAAAAGEKKSSWDLLPDLLVVDGGKGQLNVALEVLDEFGLRDQVPAVGLAKQEEEIFLPDRADSVLLPRTSEGLYLMQRVRDEAHRFAITYHRTAAAQADHHLASWTTCRASAPSGARRC